MDKQQYLKILAKLKKESQLYESNQIDRKEFKESTENLNNKERLDMLEELKNIKYNLTGEGELTEIQQSISHSVKARDNEIKKSDQDTMERLGKSFDLIIRLLMKADDLKLLEDKIDKLIAIYSKKQIHEFLIANQEYKEIIVRNLNEWSKKIIQLKTKKI